MLSCDRHVHLPPTKPVLSVLRSTLKGEKRYHEKGGATTHKQKQTKLTLQTFRCQTIAVWESNLTLSAHHADRATVTLSAITRMLRHSSLRLLTYLRTLVASSSVYRSDKRHLFCGVMNDLLGRCKPCTCAYRQSSVHLGTLTLIRERTCTSHDCFSRDVSS